MIALRRVRLAPSGIDALDMRPAQDAIRRKYGPRYHVMDECMTEVAALWGIGLDRTCINDAGVFVSYETLDHRAGRCRAELCYARSPSGLWAMTTCYEIATGGSGSAPCVWNRIAFQSEADARAAGLHDLIALFRNMAAHGIADARKLADALDAERMPQLALF